MVTPVYGFVNLQRPLIVVPRPCQISQSPKHAAEIVDISGHTRVVWTVCGFINLQRPLIVLPRSR